MERINLIATKISFNFNCVIYDVEVKTDKNIAGVVTCVNDINEKDLVLKPTIIDNENKKVIFSLDTMTPHFYESIINKTIKDYNEIAFELDKIYKVGDIVGCILIP